MTHPGRIVKALRKRKGMSVAELSKLSGITAMTIYNCEHEMRDTSYSIVMALVDALGYELAIRPKEDEETVFEGNKG